MKKTVTYLGLSAFLFATMEIGLKLAGSRVGTLEITFVRFFIAGMMIIPLAVKEHDRGCLKKDIFTKRNIFTLIVLGGLLLTAAMLCYQMGVLKCNAATSSVMISFTPIYVIIINCILKYEKINLSRILVIVFGCLGLFFTTRPWDMQSGNLISGVILLTVSPCIFALYTIMGQKTGKRIGTMTMTSISFIISSIVIFVVAIIRGEISYVELTSNWMLVLYVGVFATGFGYLFYFIIIDRTDAVTGALVFYIKPVIAPILAVVVLDEYVCWNTIVGIIFFLIASYINLYKPDLRLTKIY